MNTCCNIGIYSSQNGNTKNVRMLCLFNFAIGENKYHWSPIKTPWSTFLSFFLCLEWKIRFERHRKTRACLLFCIQYMQWHLNLIDQFNSIQLIGAHKKKSATTMGLIQIWSCTSIIIWHVLNYTKKKIVQMKRYK